jgi:Ca2+-binding EF-hand superfamily protein
MKLSKSLIAAAVVATLPLAAFAGDKDKTVTPTTTATSSQFNALDTNRDGRISPAEAKSDTKIVFSTADKNGDGYLDSDEYMHLDMTTESMPTHPATDTETPRK